MTKAKVKNNFCLSSLSTAKIHYAKSLLVFSAFVSKMSCLYSLYCIIINEQKERQQQHKLKAEEEKDSACSAIRPK